MEILIPRPGRVAILVACAAVSLIASSAPTSALEVMGDGLPQGSLGSQGYVALAEATNVPLATLDRRLVRAAGPTCRFLAPP